MARPRNTTSSPNGAPTARTVDTAYADANRPNNAQPAGGGNVASAAQPAGTRAKAGTSSKQPQEKKPMRLFTHISFLATLLAMLASALTVIIATIAFGLPRPFLLIVIPVGCVCYFLSLLIAHFISRPLTELVRKMHSYQTGDKSVMFAPTGAMREADELSKDIKDFIDVYDARVDELVALNERQDTFVSDVAHEFRTPLTAISGNAELMLDPDMPQQTREHFCEIILTEAERLKKLTNGLLALQHAKEGTPGAALSRLNIEAVAHDVVDILEPIAQDKDVSLTVEGAAPDILANEDRFKQALINLIDNAIRHVEQGGHVRVILSGINNQAVVAVKDDGSGIHDIDPVLLFKRFYRGDASRARNSGGAGLGLAIVKEIVEDFDGSVAAANALDGGAVFTMTFPAMM